ncbi:glycosyltransferase [Candidatus Pelagibacter bacterium nBUS_32]|uniref:glycosyltransferase n=1 Tax=Candidatus Pelagibacter bacterium nBUS_32 TaxID=3374192 RepID=UPI003EBE388B
MQNKKKIFFWSPLLSHVGTINAVEKSAYALKKYLNYDVYLINVFGEFDHLQRNNNFNILNIFSLRNWPKTGLKSKFIIYLFTIFSIFKLNYYYKKYKPDLIISNLVGYLPNTLKFFYPELNIANSIQGLPKFNLIRKIIWNIFYSKADYIFTMTEITKKNILENINYKKKILKIDNPIISRRLRKLSMENIDDNEERKIFNKTTFCSVGRLTKQKNFIEIVKAVNDIPREFHSKFNVIIVGSGEDYKKIKKLIEKYKLINIFLLGFKKNPYLYIKNSDYFISSSLWEEPGHALLEAGYLNKLIISSNCPNGPRELLINNLNSIKYDLNNYKDLSQIINKILNNKIKNQFQLKLNMKKIVKNYTMFRFSKKLQGIIDQSSQI